MIVARAVVAVLVGLPTVAFAQGEAVFRSDVRLVNVTATVRDANGGVVGGLDVEDFHIIDGESEREIVVFERQTDRPLSVMLLIDSSMSTAIELEFERSSAKRFIANIFGEGSHAQDRVAVMEFSEGVRLVAPFTRRERTLGRALGRIKPDTGTSLYDGVLLASEELARREGRRVIVIVTDGGDTTSYSSYRDSIETAQAADAVIYSIVVQPVKADAGRNVGGERTLRMFADGTGGKSFVEYGEAGLNRVFAEILENLRTQYLLGYYPPAHEDWQTRYREITVSVDRPGATVLARAGYYVPEDKGYLPESVPTAAEPIEPDAGGRWRDVTPAETATPEQR